MIGLLTETIGNPTPIDNPVRARRGSCRARDLPFPIAPQEWHFRQSIDYSVTANRAVLDIASRNRENLLFNIYRMGKNSIERGNRDTLDGRLRAHRRDAVAAASARAGGGDLAAAAAVAAVQTRRAARPGDARSARLHHAVRPARLPDGDEVRQRAAQDRRDRASRDRARSRSAARAIRPARSS